MPLFAQVGRDDDEDLAPPSAQRCEMTKPAGLAQPHFVGKDDATRKRIAAGEERGINLMRVEIDL